MPASRVTASRVIRVSASSVITCTMSAGSAVSDRRNVVSLSPRSSVTSVPIETDNGSDTTVSVVVTECGQEGS